MSQILLVRHGETEWNRDRLWQGWRDSNLTPKGEAQARQNAKVLEQEQVSRVYASPLQRVKQTLRCINEVFPVSVQYDERLREISMGDWEGVHVEDAQRRNPREYEKWLRDKENLGAPNGESYANVRGRLKAFLLSKGIIGERGTNEYHQFGEGLQYKLCNKENTAIVCHGIAIKLILELLSGIACAAIEFRGIPNDAVHAVRNEGDSIRFTHYRSGLGPVEGSVSWVAAKSSEAHIARWYINATFNNLS